MRTTATMMFGVGETYAQRVEHMEVVRDLQDRTGGFTAWIPWTFQKENTELDGKVEEAGGFEYLKTLAVSRLFLDNVKHVQGSWVTQGPKIGQVSLSFGADDLGSIMIEENVVYAAGARNRMTAGRDAPRSSRTPATRPVQRRTLYDACPDPCCAAPIPTAKARAGFPVARRASRLGPRVGVERERADPLRRGGPGPPGRGEPRPYGAEAVARSRHVGRERPSTTRPEGRGEEDERRRSEDRTRGRRCFQGGSERKRHPLGRLRAAARPGTSAGRAAGRGPTGSGRPGPSRGSGRRSP